MSTEEKCATCRFAGKQYTETLDGRERHEMKGMYLRCRLNPPQVTDAGFPVVHREDWCGQYQPAG